jgi:alkylhydroperoxidase/carboxymuconolactone decarboxylase family protein YurZ
VALSERDARLLRLSTAVVLGDWDALVAVRRSAPAGEPDRGWREALLQAHLFAGFPRVVESYAVLGPEGGLGEPGSDEVLGEADLPARGAELFERIYAGHAGRVRAFLRAGHPDFAAWVAGHAYGRVLTRPGLGADRRELLAVAALAATDQDRQLASHARGALRCGASQGELSEALEVVRALIGDARCERALRIVARLGRG